MDRYEVVVIGGGPGGYVAAIKAASSGKKTALIEKEELGGVCLNWGCIPTKSLLRNAEIIRLLGEGSKYGFTAENVNADYRAAHDRSREVSARLVKGVNYLMKKNGVTVIKDRASFKDGHTLSLEGGGEIGFDSAVIASGSTPARLPMLDYSDGRVLDSKKALQLESAPGKLLIIGAGAIGMEFATVFSSYGSEVTVVEMMPHVLPNEDAEAAETVRKAMEKRGVRFFESAKVLEVRDGEAVIEKDGETTDVAFDCVLAAAGIRPNTEGLGLEAAGVETDERGYIVTDGRMRTSADGIYAIGDVTGKLALAHTASAQALRAVSDICGLETDDIIYENIPRCTYTSPEVASAGLTAEKAAEQGYDAAEAVFPLSANGKAIAYGEDEGFAKLVWDREYGQLLGACLTGCHATEMIYGIAGYIGMEMTVEEMASVIHPHPTVSEVLMEAAHIAAGSPIHI